MRSVFCLAALFSAKGQKGIGSLNDPCDCMQHHDFWVASRRALTEIFWTPDYPLRVFDPLDQLHVWTKSQSCMYSPENEESHRPTALSDCIPGFLLVHIICMQRHLTYRNPERAMDFATELVRLLPFGVACIDKASGWPITSAQIWGYYRRFRRAFAAGPKRKLPQSLEGLDIFDMFERGEQTNRLERLDPASERENWPTSLLQEMLWQVSGEEKDEKGVLGEEADTCPAGSFPKEKVCWLLGKTGASCEEACRDAGLQLQLQETTKEVPPLNAVEGEWPSWLQEPRIPHIVAAMGGDKSALEIQHPWAPFECLVAEESRFHLAAKWIEEDPAWSYPICALACPCTPVVAQGIQEILEAVPMWPSAL